MIAAEPLRWEYRRDDHPVNRLHALTGVGDPVALFVGNYNRQSALTGRWTDLPVEQQQREGWRRVRLSENAMPTVGANGYLVRRTAFEAVPIGDYLFDIDHAYELVRSGHRTMALVDVAIHHDFCDGYRQFVRKTRRRVDDYFYFSSTGQRSFPWQSHRRRRGVIEFVFATTTLIPLVADVRRGMRAVRDPAWWFHPVACWLTLSVYAAGVIRGRFRPGHARSRGLPPMNAGRPRDLLARAAQAAQAHANFGAGRVSVPPPQAKRRQLLRIFQERGHELFVESGTYRGDTVAYFLRHARRIISVEVEPTLHAAAQQRFADEPSVSIVLGDALDVIPSAIEHEAASTLLFLDGHCSGGSPARGASTSRPRAFSGRWPGGEQTPR